MQADSDDLERLYNQAYGLTGSQPAEAMQLVEELRSLASQGSNWRFVALACYVGGFAQINMGEYAKAMDLFQQGFSLSRDKGLAELLVKFHNAFGVLYFQLGSFSDAVNEYEQGLTKARELHLRRETGQFLNNLGLIAMQTAKPDEALRLLSEAEQLIDQLNDPLFACAVLNNLGDLQLAEGDIDRASAYAERCLGLAEASGSAKYLIACYLQLASIATKRQEHGRAERLAAQALELSRNHGFDELAVEARLALAGSLLADQKPQAAAAEYGAAIEDIDGLASKLSLGPALAGRAKALQAQGDYPGAYEDLCRSIEVNQGCLREEASSRLTALETVYQLEKVKQEAEHARLRQQHLEKTNKRLRIINHIADALTSSHEPASILKRMWQELRTVIEIDGLSLGVYNQDQAVIDFPYIISLGETKPGLSIYLDDEASVAARCVRERRTLYYRSRHEALKAMGKSSLASVSKPKAYQSLLYVPMFRGDPVIGVMTIQSYQADAYPPDIIEMIEAIASFASIAIENARMLVKLEEANRAMLSEKELLESVAIKSAWLAEHDTLTSLPNRRLLRKVLDTSLRLCSINQSSLALFYMDLNDFKPVNDEFGHETGDRVLIQVARRLSKLFRNSDFLARVGGDEFIAVAIGVQADHDPEVVRGKIHAAFAEPIEVDEVAIGLGISVGISLFPSQAKTAADLIKAADLDMYANKPSRLQAEPEDPPEGYA